MRLTSIVSLLGFIASATVTSALDDAQKCQAAKNKIAGKYAFCRQKAEAKAVKTGDPVDYSKCDATFSTKLDDAEAGGAGMCPDNILTEDMAKIVQDHTSAVAVTLAGTGKRVFVTKDCVDAASIGGLNGADAFCQNEADSNILGGNWTAWLSTATTDARDRIVDQPYRRLDGRLVATSLADLLDGSLRAPITLHPEVGGSWGPHAALVLTATNADGTYVTSNFNDSDCSGWTSNTGTASGGANFSEDRWTLFFGGGNCSNCTNLYCFEQ